MTDAERITNPDPWLNVKEGALFMGTSVPTFWRRVKDKTLPQPVKFGNMSRWPRSELIEALERMKAARNVA